MCWMNHQLQSKTFEQENTEPSTCGSSKLRSELFCVVCLFQTGVNSSQACHNDQISWIWPVKGGNPGHYLNTFQNPISFYDTKCMYTVISHSISSTVMPVNMLTFDPWLHSITTLLHEYSVLMGQTTLIFELGLRFDLNYTCWDAACWQ